jgi:hypothetical protein
MKMKIMHQLRTLEQEELITSSNEFQYIINAIAKVTDQTAPLNHSFPYLIRTSVTNTVTDSKGNRNSNDSTKLWTNSIKSLIFTKSRWSITSNTLRLALRAWPRRGGKSHDNHMSVM